MSQMNKNLSSLGYDMSDIEWRTYRNSSSSGSSGMDLESGPVSKANY